MPPTLDNHLVSYKTQNNIKFEYNKYQGQFIKMIYDEIIEVNNDVH